MEPTNRIIFTTCFVPISEEKVQSTINCLCSFWDQADKYIVVQNGSSKGISYFDRITVDHYIINMQNRYHAGAINQCIDMCRDDDYVVISNNDLINVNTQLKDLCIPDTIVSPTVSSSQPYGAHASFFCLQKKLFMKVGYCGFENGHAQDVVWFEKAKNMGIQMISVQGEVRHADGMHNTINNLTGSEFDPESIKNSLLLEKY